LTVAEDSRIPLQLSQQCVVASIQVDLDDDVLLAFKRELLELLSTSGARGVILDLSGVSVMDADDFRALRDTMDMARLMGAASIVSGLQPGVVSALIDLDANTEGVEATLTLDDAYAHMAALRAERPERGAIWVDDAEPDEEPVDSDVDTLEGEGAGGVDPATRVDDAS
jgi:rsbT antagonist protein RsbS